MINITESTNIYPLTEEDKEVKEKIIKIINDNIKQLELDNDPSEEIELKLNKGIKDITSESIKICKDRTYAFDGQDRLNFPKPGEKPNTTNPYLSLCNIFNKIWNKYKQITDKNLKIDFLIELGKQIVSIYSNEVYGVDENNERQLNNPICSDGWTGRLLSAYNTIYPKDINVILFPPTFEELIIDIEDYKKHQLSTNEVLDDILITTTPYIVNCITTQKQNYNNEENNNECKNMNIDDKWTCNKTISYNNNDTIDKNKITISKWLKDANKEIQDKCSYDFNDKILDDEYNDLYNDIIFNNDIDMWIKEQNREIIKDYIYAIAPSKVEAKEQIDKLFSITDTPINIPILRHWMMNTCKKVFNKNSLNEMSDEIKDSIISTCTSYSMNYVSTPSKMNPDLKLDISLDKEFVYSFLSSLEDKFVKEMKRKYTTKDKILVTDKKLKAIYQKFLKNLSK